MDELRPGADGEPLPAGEIVLRLAEASKDYYRTGKPSPAAFALSTADRAARHPRLSVWASRLTTPLQAWTLMGMPERQELVLHLPVDAVRLLRPEPDDPAVPSLDVVWEPLVEPDATSTPVPVTAPGAAGHAGITGLQWGGPVGRSHTKSFRSQLADLAAVRPLSEFRQPSG